MASSLCAVLGLTTSSLILGYLNKFPPTLVNAWSSGTGMAGVAGSALYLLYVGVDLTLEYSHLPVALLTISCVGNRFSPPYPGSESTF